MAATIKVANRLPLSIQIAPGVVLKGAQGTDPGVTEDVDAETFAKWREVTGDSIDPDAVFELKGDLKGNDKAVISGAGGIADKPSTDAPGVSDPVEPSAQQTGSAPAAPSPAPGVMPAAKPQPAAVTKPAA